MSTSLFNLTTQYLQLADTLSALDLDVDTISDTIEASGLVDSIADKAQGLEHIARGAEAFLPAIDAEIARLQALKAYRVKVAAGLRSYLLDSMRRMQIERVDCPMFSISIRKNPTSVDVFDYLKVTGEYLREIPKSYVIDKTLVKEALKAGKDVPGARLKQTHRLSIK